MGIFDTIKNRFSKKEEKPINIENYLSSITFRELGVIGRVIQYNDAVKNKLIKQVDQELNEFLGKKLQTEIHEAMSNQEQFDKIKTLLTDDTRRKNYMFKIYGDQRYSIRPSWEDSPRFSKKNFDLNTDFFGRFSLDFNLMFNRNYNTKKLGEILKKHISALDFSPYVESSLKRDFIYYDPDSPNVYVDQSLLKNQKIKEAFDNYVAENHLVVKSLEELINKLKDKAIETTDEAEHAILSGYFNILPNFDQEKIERILKHKIKKYIRTLDAELYIITENGNDLFIDLNKDVLKERGEFNNTEINEEITKNTLDTIYAKINAKWDDIEKDFKNMIKKQMPLNNFDSFITGVNKYDKNYADFVEVNLSYNLLTDKLTYPNHFDVKLSERPTPEIYYILNKEKFEIYIPKKLIESLGFDIANFSVIKKYIPEQFTIKMQPLRNEEDQLIEAYKDYLKHDFDKLKSNVLTFYEKIIKPRFKNEKVDSDENNISVSLDRITNDLSDCKDNLFNRNVNGNITEFKLKPLETTIIFEIEYN